MPLTGDCVGLREGPQHHARDLSCFLQGRWQSLAESTVPSRAPPPPPPSLRQRWGGCFTFSPLRVPETFLCPRNGAQQRKWGPTWPRPSSSHLSPAWFRGFLLGLRPQTAVILASTHTRAGPSTYPGSHPSCRSPSQGGKRPPEEPRPLPACVTPEPLPAFPASNQLAAPLPPPP